ncbi:PIN domain-containing protein [Dolichospermum circinale CS-1225]|uniref:type II toxin-antitoxin system VapC family toxin n=1 Tax=Dolichospermum circinale TaxID=109265 RepID=UPI00232DBEE4|nr:PIN domain-containing protein [Dolichospermum circinale]MDB9468463.1 PIN domain-containing protein [Dolichospermum circinale CS-539/09]MDB9471806.1 PIN domain-containing protein [Dolichospermum circinale CS-539]MDB9523774.1 PIN domain-containing protein [Dolichospermum circinale CS-1225]
MIIVDTGFWLALANKNDLLHEVAKKQFQNLANEKFITTWCVVTETCYLLQKRIGIDAPKIFIHKISMGKLQVFDLKQNHCDRIEQLMQKYRDLPMDLADASLVILAEELGHGQILSVDYRDFNTYRWKNTQPFQNLFQELI